MNQLTPFDRILPKGIAQKITAAIRECTETEPGHVLLLWELKDSEQMRTVCYKEGTSQIELRQVDSLIATAHEDIHAMLKDELNARRAGYLMGS